MGSEMCIRDREAMFDVYDTLLGVVKVATGVLSTLKVGMTKATEL